ncbi:MAG: 16S rRNA (adenine(1518)-N(6)/adenine(1519)-N(6))-dimethyltransferase RsmA [Gemmatimonadaceae bacterium]
MGQHFLVDQDVLAAIAAAVRPEADDLIIEIGPGRGALTAHLARFPNDLLAVELDKALSEKLRVQYASRSNVRIVEGDVLALDLSTLSDGPFVVVGNVPYYITTPILFHVMKAPFPRHAVFLVQREVAERIVAAAGSKAYGALSANVQAIADAEIILDVGPDAFRPPPKVHSSVIRITPKLPPMVSGSEADAFRRFVQALFGMRRKQISNVLRSVASLTADQVAETLTSLGIDPRARPETLSPEMLISLMRAATTD